MSEVLELPRIHSLPPPLANRIAAGEVVERPASVVKELLENALDARCDQIRIDLERGGIARIRVSDNGHGIHVDDLPLILERHSTSKLSTAEELCCIQTLGFRGEALGAIASVSKFSIMTSTQDYGAHLECQGMRDITVTPVAHKLGTTVEVRDLFFNTPARRKFLRTEWTEYQHIQQVIRQIALSHFNTGFSIYHNNRRVMSFPVAVTDYERRILDVMGKPFMKNARRIDVSNDMLRLWGWLGDPAAARNQSDRQHVFLNGRAIRDRQVNHAIRIAYNERIYPGRYPCFVLFLEMSPHLADVNVHPSKYEVRFARARDVHDFIHAGVLRALDESAGLFSELPVMRTKSRGATGRKTVPDQVNEQLPVYPQRQQCDRADAVNTKLGSLKCMLHGRFAILEADGNMTLFDIHAARRSLAGMTFDQAENKALIEQKPLLFPASQNISADQLDQIEEDLQTLQKYGIDLRRQGPWTLTLRQLPVVLKFADPSRLLQDLVDTILQRGAVEYVVKTTLLEHVNDRSEQTDNEELQQLIQSFLDSEADIRTSQNVRRTFDEQALLSLLKRPG